MIGSEGPSALVSYGNMIVVMNFPVCFHFPLQWLWPGGAVGNPAGQDFHVLRAHKSKPVFMCCKALFPGATFYGKWCMIGGSYRRSPVISRPVSVCPEERVREACWAGSRLLKQAPFQ